MWSIVTKNYKTYVDTVEGRPERFWFRILFFILGSLFFSLLTLGDDSSAYSIMATGLTVLTGFTFTALFSDHALASSGLPKAKTETDLVDQQRLEKLSTNFAARSAYFVVLSILTIALLVTMSFRFSPPSFATGWFVGFGWNEIAPQIMSPQDISFLLTALSFVFGCLIFFLYLECLYTFYRMAESMLAILDVRRRYFSRHSDEE